MEDRTFKCIHCGNPVRGGSGQCPHCGREVTDPELWYVKYARNIVGAVFGAITAIPVFWFAFWFIVDKAGWHASGDRHEWRMSVMGYWFWWLAPLWLLIGGVVGFFVWDKIALWMGSGGGRGRGPRRYWRI